jgi:hypothetical protein
MSDTIIDLNPLDEPVNEKRYTQPNINTQNIDFNAPIEEPRFQPPPFEKKEIPKQEYKKPDPVNPELSHVSKKDKEMASSQAAKLIIQGYEWAHDFANKGLQVSEKKLNKLQAEGEINLNAMIDYDYGKKMRAGEFFQEYNKQVEGILKVSDEFKQEVTPVLERVLAKRGIGMTDEQFLIYLFGKDIAAKSLIFFQQKATLNYMIQSIKDSTAGQTAPPPRPQQQYNPPPPPPQPAPNTDNSNDEFAQTPRQQRRNPEQRQQRRNQQQPQQRNTPARVRPEPIYKEPEELEVDNEFDSLNKNED